MKKVGKIALIAAAAMMSVAPTVAQAADSRPSAVYFAAPSQLNPAALAPLAGSQVRAGLRMGKSSKLFGATGIVAFFTAIAGFYGYSSLKNFFSAIENGTFTGKPASPGTFG